LAQQAREERTAAIPERGINLLIPVPSSESELPSEDDTEHEHLTEAERKRLRERESLRKEKAREREKELRLSHIGGDSKSRSKRYSKYNFRIDRDISEKVALGIARPAVSAESMYDQRLFNQTSGIASGFGDEDSYSLYDKPLFNGSSANTIYRPKKQETEIANGVSTEKITGLLNQKPHKGFSGTDQEASIRSGPVLFEKESDVFGMDAFMSAAKRGRGEQDEPNKRQKA
jgi:SNW domain-containing protein 1